MINMAGSRLLMRARLARADSGKRPKNSARMGEVISRMLPCPRQPYGVGSQIRLSCVRPKLCVSSRRPIADGMTNGICTAGFSSRGRTVRVSRLLFSTIFVVPMTPAASSSTSPSKVTRSPVASARAVTRDRRARGQFLVGLHQEAGPVVEPALRNQLAEGDRGRVEVRLVLPELGVAVVAGRAAVMRDAQRAEAGPPHANACRPQRLALLPVGRVNLPALRDSLERRQQSLRATRNRGPGRRPRR